MARRRRQGERGTAPIIRRSEPAGDAASHGGAWKVAYADFVTAMMAFFLIMWLLNATTEDQRKGLADYFSPNNLMSHASSGSGRPFGGKTALEDGALVSDRGAVQIFPGTRPITEPSDEPSDDVEPNVPPATSPTAPEGAAPGASSPGGGQSSASSASSANAGSSPNQAPVTMPIAAERAKAKEDENRRLQSAADEIRRVLASDPAVGALAGHVLVDVTPRGLRVQVVDGANQAMFPLGSADPNDAARLLIRKIVPTLQNLPGQLEIDGYTDAAPYPGPDRTNWDLSAERANAARRLLMSAGIPEARVREVTGHADHDLLIKDRPLAPANRRIAIIVLRPSNRPSTK